MAWNIVFEPLVPVALILTLALPGALLLVYSAFRRARGAPLRTVALAVLVIALLNPTIRSEDREAVPAVSAIIVDRSQSQDIGGRPAQTDA
ncbi:MAG: hypothetical protein LPK90_13285, partial [Alphaproteobacteria bacterium]|nr:hypothetical protein [Alphaproteobacteria bacterium]MDX5494641.1 hypothetical protein [Alphaproteobacteria bacterium]